MESLSESHCLDRFDLRGMRLLSVFSPRFETANVTPPQTRLPIHHFLQPGHLTGLRGATNARTGTYPAFKYFFYIAKDTSKQNEAFLRTH